MIKSVVVVLTGERSFKGSTPRGQSVLSSLIKNPLYSDQSRPDQLLFFLKYATPSQHGNQSTDQMRQGFYERNHCTMYSGEAAFY